MWTEKQTKSLKTMLGSGATMRQGAEALGAEFTRNARLGKAHRMGIPSPRSPSPVRKPVGRRDPKLRVVARTADHILNADLPLLSIAARFRAFQPVTIRKGIFELEHGDCRDLDASGTYCAAPTEKGRSYCSYHARLHVPAADHAPAFRPEDRGITILLAALLVGGLAASVRDYIEVSKSARPPRK